MTQGDVANAFFNGDLDGRELYLELPPLGIPGVARGSLLKCKKAVYGLVNAPKQWWRKMRTTLLELGAKESILEPCLFWVYDDNQQLCGCLAVHVDDCLMAGNEYFTNHFLHNLHQQLKWGSWTEHNFVHCGRQITQDTKTLTITVDQQFYSDKIQPPKRDNKDPAPNLTADDLDLCRPAMGCLSWLSRQTRPDVSFDASRLLGQLQVGNSKETINEIASLCREAKKYKTTAIHYPRLADKIDDLIVLVICDAAWGNLKDGKSQGGHFCGITTNAILSGESDISMVLWSTARIKRVCRSPLAAETQELNNGFENADWLRLLLLEARFSDFQIRRWREYQDTTQAVVASDAKSIYDHLTKETATAINKYT